ncbi:MAG: hypothetical protein IKF06_05940 [Lachnospiraceae bacterium]|nr:hypothetical protein [Lachnospiraceae bacterium]
MQDGYVLAMFDIRGKQKYIYNTSKMKEIIAASEIIRDCFKDYLYPAAIRYRNTLSTKNRSAEPAIYNYEEERDQTFSFEAFEQRMMGRQYIGEVVYSGGGNFLVLFQNEEICRNVNKAFSRAVLVGTASLRVLCTFISGIDKEYYHSDPHSGRKGDQERLYALHAINEDQEPALQGFGTLPIVQVDRKTSQPLTSLRVVEKDTQPEKITSEAAAKYDKYYYKVNHNQDWYGEKVLDALLEKKGEDSLLAIIYIDGNNMGARVQECLEGKHTYDECINELRRFSAEIQKVFIDDRMPQIDRMLAEKDRNRRLVVGAGDEITVICNAHDAFCLATEYLKLLPLEQHYSSCAGISIFHSHTSFAEAYRIAEECCENGKKRMKEAKVKNACFLDFHYCQGAIGVSLEEIRREEGTKGSLPWFVCGDEEETSAKDYELLTDVEKTVNSLRMFGRSNVKGLLEAARKGGLAFEKEIRRIEAHMEPKKRSEVDFNWFYSDKSRKAKLVADIVRVYDLWFRE